MRRRRRRKRVPELRSRAAEGSTVVRRAVGTVRSREAEDLSVQEEGQTGRGRGQVVNGLIG